MSDLGSALLANESRKRLDRYKRSLWALCTEVLGYDKLSETFHRPMLDAWDRIDQGRHYGKIVDTLDLWPRDHIKTWCMRARVIRYYLRNPETTVTGWHAVEEMAQDSGVAIGKTLQQNKELRRLFPAGVLPSPMAKKFVTSSGFSLRSNRIGDAPSFRAWGAGSEATGGHSMIGWLDDINAYNDLVDSQFPKRKQWYQATVRNVVRSDGWVDGIGTRWDRDDTWAFLMGLPGWVTTTRAALETGGVPDYAGEPVYLTRGQIEKKRAELGEAMFALQMMNDPLPAGQTAWTEECERYVSVRDTEGPGLIAVISDPAPSKIGSGTSADSRYMDGEKNWWFISVWKLRRRGQIRERILLDIDCSREWEPSFGFEKMVRMGMAHNVRFTWALEKTGQATALYTNDVNAAARSLGAACREVTDRDGKSGLVSTYTGKNPRFRRFSDMAKYGEILICESAKGAALEMALDQARRWRFITQVGDKNGLRFDDGADCMSYVSDPVWECWIPNAEPRPLDAISEMFRKNQEQYAYGGRYVQF